MLWELILSLLVHYFNGTKLQVHVARPNTWHEGTWEVFSLSATTLMEPGKNWCFGFYPRNKLFLRSHLGTTLQKLAGIFPNVFGRPELAPQWNIIQERHENEIKKNPQHLKCTQKYLTMYIESKWKLCCFESLFLCKMAYKCKALETLVGCMYLAWPLWYPNMHFMGISNLQSSNHIGSICFLYLLVFHALVTENQKMVLD